MAYDAQPVGVLATLVDNIQQWANEPKIKSKYTASKLYPLVQANWKECFSEVMRIADNSFLCRYTFTITNDTEVTLLPVNVGTIFRIGEVDANTNEMRTTYYTRSRRNPFGPGMRFEGNMIRWAPVWQGGTREITVEYVPNGETNLAYGTATTSDVDSTTLVLDTTPNEGYFDKRPNVYVGAWVRLLGAGSSLTELPAGYAFFPTQERLIKSYDPDNEDGPKITVESAFDFDPSSGLHNGASGFTDIRYEIVPDGMQQMTPVIAWRTIMTLHRIEGNTKRLNLAREEYAAKFRDIKMTVASLDSERGSRFEHDTYLYLNDLWALM